MKKWKKIFLILLIVTLLFAISSVVAIVLVCKKISNAYITVACAEVKEDGSFEWKDEDRRSVLNDDPFRSLVFLLTARGNKVEDTLTDVELAEFRFVDKDFRSLYTFYVAYDYALKNVYIKRQDHWYLLKNTNTLDTVIHSSLECSMHGLYGLWKVQSMYGLENWARVDLNDLVFRYNVHWGSQNKPSHREYRDSGFKNIQPTTIETKEQAIARAAEELGYEFPVGVVFYDKTCGYWMVELYDALLIDECTDVSEYTDFLHLNVYTVVMDDKGITLETYQAVTNYRPFLVLANYMK